MLWYASKTICTSRQMCLLFIFWCFNVGCVCAYIMFMVCKFTIKVVLQSMLSLNCQYGYGRTSYRNISRSLEAVGRVFRLYRSLYNLPRTSAEALPSCLSSFRSIWSPWHLISGLRCLTGFGDKRSYRLMNRGQSVFRYDTVDYNTAFSNVSISGVFVPNTTELLCSE